MHAHRSVLEGAARGCGEQIQQVLVDAWQQRLGLGVAEAGVELQHPRSVGGHHQPGIEDARERRAAAGHLGNHRSVDLLHERVGEGVGDVGDR